MFVLRALFWLAAVAILMPEELDLGLSAEFAHDRTFACRGDGDLCESGLEIAATVRAAARDGLSRVRRDLAEARGAREAPGF